METPPPFGSILDQYSVQHAVTLAWERSHSPAEVIGMIDEHLQQVTAARTQEDDLFQGHIFIPTLAGFAQESSWTDRRTIVQSAEKLLSKHNPQGINAAKVLAMFASDLKSKGLIVEAQSLAARLQRSMRSHFKNEPLLMLELKEVLS